MQRNPKPEVKKELWESDEAHSHTSLQLEQQLFFSSMLVWPISEENENENERKKEKDPVHEIKVFQNS